MKKLTKEQRVRRFAKKRKLDDVWQPRPRCNCTYCSAWRKSERQRRAAAR